MLMLESAYRQSKDTLTISGEQGIGTAEDNDDWRGAVHHWGSSAGGRSALSHADCGQGHAGLWGGPSQSGGAPEADLPCLMLLQVPPYLYPWQDYCLCLACAKYSLMVGPCMHITPMQSLRPLCMMQDIIFKVLSAMSESKKVCIMRVCRWADGLCLHAVCTHVSV